MHRKWDPKLYEQTASVQHRLAFDLIDRLASIHGKESVLDIGCGDGFVTHHLSQTLSNGHVLGVDPSNEMITHAQSLYRQSNLKFQCLGAEEITFEEKYHRIISCSAMMWVKEQFKAMQAIFRALKPEGKFVVLFWPWTDYYWLPAEYVIKTEKWAKKFEHFSHGFQCFDMAGYRLLLELAGFQVAHIETKLHDLRYKTVEQYACVITSFLPHLAYLENDEERKVLLKDITGQYVLMAGRDSSGAYFGPTRHIEVVAIKS